MMSSYSCHAVGTSMIHPGILWLLFCSVEFWTACGGVSLSPECEEERGLLSMSGMRSAEREQEAQETWQVSHAPLLPVSQGVQAAKLLSKILRKHWHWILTQCLFFKLGMVAPSRNLNINLPLTPVVSGRAYVIVIKITRGKQLPCLEVRKC